MMATTVKGDRAVQRCIEKYLGEINAALERVGVSRSEIRDVVDDVRAQIAEMLASRSEGEPTLQDAQAVIAELDAPESYASEAESLERKPPVPRRLSNHALGGAVILFLSVPATAFFGVLLMPDIDRVTSPEGVAGATYSALLLAGLLWLVLLICPLILGAVAISKIRRSGGRLYGLRLAFAEVLVAPLLILAVFSYVLAGLFREPLGLLDEAGLAFLIWCVLALVLGWSVWRAIRKPPAPSSLDMGTR